MWEPQSKHLHFEKNKEEAECLEGIQVWPRPRWPLHTGGVALTRRLARAVRCRGPLHCGREGGAESGKGEGRVSGLYVSGHYVRAHVPCGRRP